MKRVGILSDTHGRLSDQAYAALVGSDHIIHAGDIGDPAILRELETIAPVTAVLGNNDFDEYGEHVRRFAHPVIDGVRFLVAHYPRDVKISFAGNAALAPGDPIPQVCVHGHTHVPELLMGAEARPADLVPCSAPAANSPAASRTWPWKTGASWLPVSPRLWAIPSSRWATPLHSTSGGRARCRRVV